MAEVYTSATQFILLYERFFSVKIVYITVMDINNRFERWEYNFVNYMLIITDQILV